MGYCNIHRLCSCFLFCLLYGNRLSEKCELFALCVKGFRFGKNRLRNFECLFWNKLKACLCDSFLPLAFGRIVYILLATVIYKRNGICNRRFYCPQLSVKFDGIALCQIVCVISVDIVSNGRTEYLKLLQIVILNIRQLVRFAADFDIWSILIGTLYGNNGAFFTLRNLCKYLSVLF